MKTSDNINYTDFENFYPGKEFGERKHRASSFWNGMNTQRMTQSYRREDASVETKDVKKAKTTGRKTGKK